MKVFGIVLIVAGVLLTIFTGFKVFTKKKVLDVGKLEITRDEPHNFDWSPFVGVGVIVAGGIVLAVSLKK